MSFSNLEVATDVSQSSLTVSLSAIALLQQMLRLFDKDFSSATCSSATAFCRCEGTRGEKMHHEFAQGVTRIAYHT
eukprot:COSAG01_NODE_71065_length_257_cov_0.601266_1_plen_75_part_10